MKNKKDILLAVLITILAVIIALFIIGITENKEVKIDDEEIQFRNKLKSSFMMECITESKYYDYCDCAFEKLYSAVGPIGLVEMEDYTVKHDNLPDGTLEKIDQCMSLK